MRRDYRTPKLMAEINITPFTDVVLVLLIIFMVTAPIILQSTIKVNLPQASSKQPLEEVKPLYVTISSEGVIYLGAEVVTVKELRQRVDQLVKKDQQLSAVLSADQTARFKDVVSVIDVLNELGVKKLNIATKPN